MSERTKKRRRIGTEMARATSYGRWHALAEELDWLDGNQRWQREDASSFYDADLLRRHVGRFRELRAQQSAERLGATLEESLYRNLPDIGAHPLYDETHTGEPKLLIEEYLAEAEAALDWLCDEEGSGIPPAVKLQRMQHAARTLGRPALLLSGGATWGIYHLGVVKALREQRLLPRILCGSSMGSVIAAVTCTRSPEELDALLHHPERIARHAFRPLSPREAVRRRAVCDPAQLLDLVRRNAGDLTFGEAHARTGLTLGISVSPTRARQKPRLLTWSTTPDVLIAEAAVASCAVPGLFPAARLMARDAQGRRSAYAPAERWYDGTLGSDLPKDRVARLHNVNHFIVSQTNPHVLPWLSSRARPGVGRMAVSLVGGMARAQATVALDVARKGVHGDPWRPLLDQVHALAGQHYVGDILIHPPLDPRLYARMMTNPTEDEVRRFIQDGERATWPQMALIRNTTRIARAMERVVGRLERKVAAARD